MFAVGWGARVVGGGWGLCDSWDRWQTFPSSGLSVVSVPFSLGLGREPEIKFGGFVGRPEEVEAMN